MGCGIQSNNKIEVLLKLALVRKLVFLDLDPDVKLLKMKVNIYIVQTHLCEMSKTGKFVETESRLVIVRG